MENKVLEKNLDRIKQYDKKLADILSSDNLITDDKKSNLSLGQTDLGEYNVLLNGIPLHSAEGAIEESKKIVSLIDKKEDTNAVRIVYGLGLGYLVDIMSESVKGKIIVYEPDINLLKLIFSIAQVDAVFKENVIICADKKTFSKHVVKHAKSDGILTLSVLPSYRTIYEKDINDIVTIAQRARGELKASENTYIFSAPLALKNTFLNLQYLCRNICMSDLKDIYKGKTALCLSAGPSLRKNIEFIKENRNKFIIFAVNPTLRLLKEYNITPDFAVIIEANDVAHQLKNIDIENTYLITDAFSSNDILKTKAKKTINYISDQNFFNHWVKKCLGLKDILFSLGTVSYTAFMSAFVMGFDKIILCGQDLAYQDGKCYAKGSQFEQLECVYDEEKKKYVIQAHDYDKYLESFVNERVTKEDAKIAANYNIWFLNNNIYTVKDQKGNDIPTQTGYALFIDWFERAAELFKDEKPELKLINSSVGGAQIDGFENIPLKEAIKDAENVEQIDLSTLNHKYDKNIIKTEFESMYKNLFEFKNSLEELKNINSKVVKEIEIKKTLTPNLIKMLQKHEDSLFKVLNSKDNKVIREVVLIFLNKYIQAVDKDYYSDLDLCKKTINEITDITNEIISYVEIFLKGLTDCKPFISE